MKAVATEPLCLIAARKGEQRCHTRHIVMKRGIKTNQLRQICKALLKRFNQHDFVRQMRGIPRRKIAKLLEQGLGQSLRRMKLRAAVNHPMDDGEKMRVKFFFRNPIDQQSRRRGMIR